MTHPNLESPTFTTGGCETARPKPRRPKSNGRSCSLLTVLFGRAWRPFSFAEKQSEPPKEA